MGCGSSKRKIQGRLSTTNRARLEPIDEKKLPKLVMDGLGKLLYGKANDRTRAVRTVSERKTDLTTFSTFRKEDEETQRIAIGATVSAKFPSTVVAKELLADEIEQSHVVDRVEQEGGVELQEAKEVPEHAIFPADISSSKVDENRDLLGDTTNVPKLSYVDHNFAPKGGNDL